MGRRKSVPGVSWRLLVKGLAMGLSIAAPVGPIGVLCIRRTLDRGRLSGLVSGLGAATADLVYGSIAGIFALCAFVMAFRRLDFQYEKKLVAA